MLRPHAALTLSIPCAQACQLTPLPRPLLPMQLTAFFTAAMTTSFSVAFNNLVKQQQIIEKVRAMASLFCNPLQCGKQGEAPLQQQLLRSLKP